MSKPVKPQRPIVLNMDRVVFWFYIFLLVVALGVDVAIIFHGATP
jgi:hypothetical protein